MKILITIRHQNYVMLEARKNKGLTQNQLANLVDTNASKISAIEQLKSIYSPEYPWDVEGLLNNIADILEVPFHKIFPGDYLDALYGGNLPATRKILFDREILALPEPSTKLLGDGVDQGTLISLITQSLNAIPPREVKVLTLRYGLNGEFPMTYEETARKMGVTRERIRQIEAQALSRLRNPSIRRQLRGFLDNET